MTQERKTQSQPEAEESVTSMLAMLATKRPGGSRSERKFNTRFILPLGVKPDKRGNFVLRIGNEPIMWSCHTDSVHNTGGEQKLTRIGQFGIGLDKSEKSNCLGADDAAGVWLMREMIRAQVPGLYVFHRDEETGCHGSKWIVKNNPKLVEGIKFAVALDRRDKADVITFQSGNRCCSDEFATSLAYQLGMDYKPCPNGSFTDTAQYTGLIGECTNISVGYTGAHSSREELDGQFLIALRDKLLSINVEALVSKRVAGTVEKQTYGSSYNSSGRCRGAYGYEHYGAPYGGRTDFYASRFGYYANGIYYPYKEEASAPVYGYMKDGVYYEDTVGPDKGGALTQKEQLNLRRGWWQRLFEKSNKPTAVSTVPVVPNGVRSNPETVTRQTSADEDEDFFQRPRKGLANLVRNNPEEVADYLEQYGVDEAELEQHILATTGTVRY